MLTGTPANGPCPACAVSATFLQLVGLRDRQHPPVSVDRPHAYARCLRCGCLFMTPCPTQAQIRGFYPSANEHYAYASRKPPALYRVARTVSQWRQPGRRALGWILPFVAVDPPGTVLDVGCGSGHFLNFMTSHAWSTWGLDISEEATRNASASHTIVTSPDSADAQLPADCFDLITLFQVLEHIPNPVASLTNLARSLKPGRILVLNTPNADCFPARKFGADWRGLECPRHVVLYKPASLAAVFERSGLGLLGACALVPRPPISLAHLSFEMKAFADDGCSRLHWPAEVQGRYSCHGLSWPQCWAVRGVACLRSWLVVLGHVVTSCDWVRPAASRCPLESRRRRRRSDDLLHEVG